MPLSTQGSIIGNGTAQKLNPTPQQTSALKGIILPSSAGASALAPQHPVQKLGTNPGMIKSTTDTSGTTHTFDTKPNESVLAQQKALNTKGAGLVEDGIIGDKTRAAIAKYATQATPPPEPEKVPEQTKPATPQVGTASQNAQTVLNAGQMSPEERKANEEVRQANELQKGYQNVQTLAPYAEASMYADRARTPAETQNIIQAPDLAGRASATQGLLGSLGNIYGSSRVAGANAALQGTQTAAQRSLSAAGTVLSASIPGQISGSARTYNPLDPTGTSGSDGIVTGANNQSKYDLITQYNSGKVAIEQAKGIENQISNTLTSNPDINNQPLSLLTNLNQYLSGQLGTAPQQLLAQQVNSYIQTLGIDPASVVSIATQQKGTLAQLLKSLRDTASNNNEAIKKTADSLGSSNSSNGGSYTSNSGNTYKLPY